MEPIILLEKLRSLVASAPGLQGRGTYGQEQFAWLGKASALIAEWNRSESISFGVAANSLAGNVNREMNTGAIFTTVHKAIASLENALPQPQGQAFGPGAAYDFFRALRALVAATDRTLFVVDPYLDAETFDGYLSASRRVAPCAFSFPSSRMTFALRQRSSRRNREAALRYGAVVRYTTGSSLSTDLNVGCWVPPSRMLH